MGVGGTAVAPVAMLGFGPSEGSGVGIRPAAGRGAG